MAQCATTALAGVVPIRSCVALAAGSGGSGRFLVLCLSCFPHPAPHVPRRVWRAITSGCPLPSLAGTPFHAVCVFRELRPVALLVVPACPLRVCALTLPRRPPPPLGGVACAPRAVPALGASRAVPRGTCPSACPAPVPCSVWCASGGAVWSRFPPTWLGAVVAWGVWGQALPLPRLPALWAGCRGPLPTGCGCGGMRAWGPVTNPTARALACGGGGMRVPGGGASCLGVGRPGSGALPLPTARPLNGLPGPTTHWLWLRGGAGVGTRHQPHSALMQAGFARCGGRHEGARGGRLLSGCGASGVSRSPTPDCPPSRQAAGAHYPLAVGAGGCGRGDPTATPQRALLRAVGAA